MRDIEKAKELLSLNDYTCVLCRGDDVKTFTQRGVRPLFELIRKGESVKGFSGADKVIGRATAFLYVLLGISEVYARVISRPALSVLTEHKISVEYDTLTDNIINRRGDGICPFEEAVLDINSAADAYEAIQKKLSETK